MDALCILVVSIHTAHLHSGVVEDVEHLVMRCAHVKEERGKMIMD